MSKDHHRIRRIAFAMVGAAVCVLALLILNRPDRSRGAGDGEKTVVDEGSKAGGNSTLSHSANSPKPSVPMPGGKPPAAGTVHVLDVAQTATQLHRAESDASEDLLILQNLIDSHRRIHGANPEGGLNFEIVGNLAGGNERKLAVLSPNHPSLSDDGELLDRWGTPYWFHPVSRDLMEIVSAGPDKNLWTEDDVRID